MICSWYIVYEVLHRNSSFRMNPAKNMATLEIYFFLIICQEIAVKVGIKHQGSTIDIPVFEVLYKDSLFLIVLLKYMAAVGNSCIRNYNLFEPKQCMKDLVSDLGSDKPLVLHVIL